MTTSFDRLRMSGERKLKVKGQKSKVQIKSQKWGFVARVIVRSEATKDLVGEMDDDILRQAQNERRNKVKS
jgi:hypothetical protein